MTNLKVKLLPAAPSIRPDNGIGRVLYAQIKYLPQFGINLVDGDADLYVGHTQQFDMPRIDCLHLHGAYWLGDKDSGAYGSYNIEANRAIIAASRRARVITTPSEWVAMPWKRDMRINPIVIGHGIDFAEWQPGQPSGYALWAKNRAIDVCLPDAPYELAKRGVNVVSTFSPENVTIPQTLNVIGRQEPDDMRGYLMNADVYLATVKETFGIQTLEAMACGVPVVGWNFGGTAEIITNDYDGILVKPYDYDALYNAVNEAKRRRAELGAHARETAAQYDWPIVIERYADLYRQIADDIKADKHGVSIVITNHNYGQYVGDAIQSALAQTMPPAEVIVVDDGSTDNSLDVLAQYPHVKVITQDNQGVAAARTTGISAATQPYICCLDADDQIAPNFIAALQPALEADRGLGIAYSAILSVAPDGSQSVWESEHDFDWEAVTTPANPPVACVPSACLFRREMWLRAGPHKQEYAPAEDTEFWVRGLSTGFEARRITKEPLFIYRVHEGSASRTLRYRPIDDRLPWMRDKRYPLGAPTKQISLIMSYSEPKVSIAVIVSKENAQYLADTIDSVLGQTMREWEMTVIDRCGDGRLIGHQLDRYPFAQHIIIGLKPLGKAIDEGVHAVRADLCLMLEAGDMLTNSALEEMCQAHVNSGGRYIYTDVLLLSGKNFETLVTPKYEQRIWTYPLHHMAALLPTAWAREALGGGDVAEFYSRLALHGHCGQHLGRALVITRHEGQPSHAKRLKKLEGQSMSNCCGGNGDAILAAKAALGAMVIEVVPPGQARLEYIYPNIGSITFHGPSGRAYLGGNNDEDRFVNMDEKDVAWAVNTGRWKVVSVAIKSDEPPEPVPPAMAPEPVASPSQPSVYDLPEDIPDVIEPSAEEVKANQAVVAQIKKQRVRR